MKISKLKITATVLVSASLFACGGGGGGSGGGQSSGGNGSSSSTSSSTSSSASSSASSSGSSGGDTVTLGGQLSGLQSGQVKISNGGASPTDMNSDGSFSFTVPSGSDYEILIESNPLEQLCFVENGSGQAGSAANDIVITCEAVSEVQSCSGLADSDEDGLTDCQELDTYFTHPWQADTDGDGFDDGREVLDFDPQNTAYIFNPRVADMAQIAVDLTAVPEIDLDFTESSGSSRAVGTQYEESESESLSSDWGGETSRQLEVGHTLSVETTQTVGTEVNVSLTDVGVSGSYESSLSVGFESSVSTTRGSSVNWSRSASQENSRAWSETVELTEEENSTYNGGFLRVTARVRNQGHIPYDLENLTLSAVLFDPLRPFDMQSIGTMEFSDGGFPRTTILAGESAPLNFSTDLTLAKAQQLLRDSKNIVVTPGTYRLIDINDQSLLLVDQDVSARTATVTVDYGIDAAREDKFRVAVNRGVGQRGISLLAALQEVLALSVEEGEGSWIFGNDSSASSTPAGLLRIGNYEMDADNNRYWLLAHNRNAEGGGRVTEYFNLLQEGYSLESLTLRAGDKVSLVYVGDRDRDGLSDRQERNLGTDRELLDTDGDGLGDGLEYYGWLTNRASPPCGQGDNLVRVYSDPLVMDSDEDGVDDASERASCDNPSFNFVANAGFDQIVNKTMQVTLNGGIEGNAQGAVSYVWHLLSGPNVEDESGVSTRTLEGRRPIFYAPDEVSTLVWELEATVNNEVQTDIVDVQVQLDRNLAVYVGTPNPEATADGSMEAPYGSISEALSAIDTGEDLYVMAQTEPYNLVNALAVPDGTSLFGGYDADWVRDVEDNLTTIIFTPTQVLPAVSFSSVSEEMWFSGFSVYLDSANLETEDDVVAVDVAASADSEALYFANNRFESADVATGTSTSPGSSYALRVNGLGSLFLWNNELLAGTGGFGANGSNGSVGTDGDDASGRTRGYGNNSAPDGGNGGVGGSGGLIVDRTGGNGATGGHVNGSIRGGAGGTGADACEHATDSGNNGDPGTAGGHGAGAAQPNYANFSTEYETSAAANGGNGGNGAGGGGGAGGGACGTADGGRGGGGGEGGTGGTRGIGGTNGGASIALWLSNVSSSELRNNTIESGLGGKAGTGGSGLRGGYGGDGASGGAPEENCVLGACDRGGWGAGGGDGGNGGRGGDGGGAAGGASFAVFISAGQSPLFFDNTLIAGVGGDGGYSRSNGGRGGDSYAIYDADTTDGAIPELVSGNDIVTGLAGNGGGTLVGSAGSAGSAEGANF